MGRPRRLLAPAPLQIRTCGTAASGSSDYGFAANAALFAIHRSSGNTELLELDFSLCFPSMVRHSVSLQWLPRASVRHLRRYYQSAPTSCRSSRPTHCSFVWRYHALLLVMRKRGVAVCRLLVGTAPVPQSSSFARARGDGQDLPGSWTAPSRTCSALRSRRTGCAKATNDASDVAFRSVDNVGSAIGHLSRLNHTACSLAVYASRLGLLRSHHARLASRWRPTLAGQDLNLLGCFRRFLS